MKEVDKFDAPPGYIAVVDENRRACRRCAFDKTVCPITPCASSHRKDGCNVIFVPAASSAPETVLLSVQAKLDLCIETLENISCTCYNPDGTYPHNPNDAQCNLSMAKATLDKIKEV